MATIQLTTLGTFWYIEIFSHITDQKLSQLEATIRQTLTHIEERFSRFRSDSLVSILNRERTLATDDADFRFLLLEGQRYYQLSKGAFNLLIGDVLEVTGYDAAYTFTPKDRVPEIGNPLVDIVITPTTIHLMRGRLDLGGIGKGFAIDQLAKVLKAALIDEFLINGGGDMYGTSEAGKPITIWLQHPMETKTFIGSSTIYHNGFAASSGHTRQWRNTTGNHTHIVGPATGATGSFVHAKTALAADVLATTLLVTDVSLHPQILEATGAVTSLYYLEDSTVTHSKGFPYTAL